MRIMSLLLAAALLLLGTGMASASTVVNYTVIFEADNFLATPAPALPAPATVFGSFSVNLDKTQNYTNQTSGIDLNSINLVFDSQLAFNYNAATDEFTFGGLAHGAAGLQSVPAENDFSMVIRHFSAGMLNSQMYQFSYVQAALGDFLFATSPASNPNGFALVIPGAVVAATPIPAGLPLFLTALAGLGFVAFRRNRGIAILAATPQASA